MMIKPEAGVEVNSRLSTPLFLIVPHILASFTQYTCWQQSEFFKKAADGTIWKVQQWKQK